MNNLNSVLTLSVFVVLLAGTVSFSYADYISPKKQLDSGVLPEDVICRDDRVLVIRDSGKVACVKESTSEKLGWNIIKIIFEDTQNNSINSLNVDLSKITLKSDILDGNYKTGLFTESQQGVMRGPAPLPFATSINVVVNQDGSINVNHLPDEQANIMTLALADNSQNAIKKPEEYLKYFPTYIPDGQELKFFTFEGHELGASIHLVYAPIVVPIDPLTLTQEKLADLGGITIQITDYPDFWSSKNDDYKTYRERGFIVDSETYPPNTIIHGIISENPGGFLTWENYSSVSFQFDSSSYNTSELLKMAETALNEN